MAQQMKQPEKKRKKAEPKQSFDAGAVFDVKPSEEIELDTESSHYRAQKGQGGDRRA
jgi:hypothetical protein